MSTKLKNILSELSTDVKAIHSDDRISFRYLHLKFLSKLQYFLRIEAKSREILKDLSLWKTIDCIKLISINSNSCGYIDSCNTLKRSETQIPEAYNTSYGQLIKVMSIDGLTEYSIIKSNDYSDYINRLFGIIKPPFWIENNYIYIPNTDVNYIKVMILPKNSKDVDILNGTATSCSSILDSDVNYPDYLITLAKQEVLKEISGVYKRTPEDEKGDLNTNIKN